MHLGITFRQQIASGVHEERHMVTPHQVSTLIHKYSDGLAYDAEFE